MSASAASGWTCPQCERRVPGRVHQCRCGFEYVRAPEVDNSITTIASERGGNRVTTLVLAAIALVAIGVAAGLYMNRPAVSVATAAVEPLTLIPRSHPRLPQLSPHLAHLSYPAPPPHPSSCLCQRRKQSRVPIYPACFARYGASTGWIGVDGSLGAPGSGFRGSGVLGFRSSAGPGLRGSGLTKFQSLRPSWF